MRPPLAGDAGSSLLAPGALWGSQLTGPCLELSTCREAAVGDMRCARSSQCLSQLQGLRSSSAHSF